MQNTIWATGMVQPVYEQVKVDELEALFENKVTGSKGVGAPKGLKKQKKEVHILEGQRAQNFGIALNRFNMSMKQLKDNILACSDKLTEDDLSSLQANIPTDDEMKAVVEYVGNSKSEKKALGKEEEYVRQMAKIPRLQNKLRAMTLRIVFDLRLHDVVPRIEALEKVSKELRDSASLTSILSLVLTIGNVMNVNTSKGSAVGFKIDVLSKLQDVRSTDRKTTLLHYAVSWLEQHNAESLAFVDAIVPPLEMASALTRDLLLNDLEDLNNKVKLAAREAEATERDASKKEFEKNKKKFEKFAKVVSEFTAPAMEEVGEKLTSAKSALESFKQTLTYFGEKYSDTDSEQMKEFFSIFLRFFSAMKKAHADNERAKAAAVKAAGTKEATTSMLSKKVIKPLTKEEKAKKATLALMGSRRRALTKGNLPSRQDATTALGTAFNQGTAEKQQSQKVRLSKNKKKGSVSTTKRLTMKL